MTEQELERARQMVAVFCDSGVEPNADWKLIKALVAEVERLRSMPPKPTGGYDETDFHQWASVYPSWEEAAKDAHKNLLWLDRFTNAPPSPTDEGREWAQWVAIGTGVALHTIG